MGEEEMKEMTKIRSEIFNMALKIIESYSDGIRYSDLKLKLIEQLPNHYPNTLGSAITNIFKANEFEGLVWKPRRGIFMHIKYKEKYEAEKQQIIPEDKIREEDFYESCAHFFINELEVCTKACALGGSLFGNKWGTPDTIGLNESKESDYFKHPPYFISIEIKTNVNKYMTAFGQADVYKQFSHFVYIVVPNNMSLKNIDYLTNICKTHSIGIVLFNNRDVVNPDYKLWLEAKFNKNIDLDNLNKKYEQIKNLLI